MADPTFPPLLVGYRLDANDDPVAKAIAGAREGSFGAGDLFWADDVDNLRFALVLQPEVPRSRCMEVLFAVMVAFGDSAGALCPPETPVTYCWPSIVLMNGARIGHVDLVLPDTQRDDIPDWMVVSLDMRVRPDASAKDPGMDINRTTIWDEGCGEVLSTALLDSASRHIVNALHNWEEDGFRPIHDQWHARLDEQTGLARGLGKDVSQRLVGMEDGGAAIIRGDGGTCSLAVEEALAKLRRDRTA